MKILSESMRRIEHSQTSESFLSQVFQFGFGIIFDGICNKTKLSHKEGIANLIEFVYETDVVVVEMQYL